MSKIKNLQHKSRALFAVFAVAVIVVGSNIGLLSAQSVLDIQRQIEQLSEDISNSEDRIDDLRDREDTLENRLQILDAEIEQARANIAETEQEISQTRNAIEEKEEELARTKELIQENVKVLYKQGDPSTLEILFSSDNFTDFINRQEYLDKVKESLNEAAKDAVTIKEELEVQEQDLLTLREEQEAQERRVAANIEEQERILEATRGEEERYQELVAQQKEELEQAQQEQAAIIAAARANSSEGYTPGSVGNGGYPAELAPPVPMNSVVDNWGFYSRQCTSYAAWKRSDLGRPIGNWGRQGIAHARFWTNSGYFSYVDENGVPRKSWVEGKYAQKDGMTVNNTPAQGAIAVLNSGQYGHVAIVEEVFNSGNSFRASEYNADWDGYYADYNVYNNTSAWTFIHD